MRQISSNHQSPVQNVKTDSDILSEEENLPNGDAFLPKSTTRNKACCPAKAGTSVSLFILGKRTMTRTITNSIPFFFSPFPLHERTFRIHLKGSLGFSSDSTITFTSHLTKAVRIVRIPKILRHRVIWTSMALGLWRHTGHAILEVIGYSLVRWCCLLEGFPNMSRNSSHWSHVPALLFEF